MLTREQGVAFRDRMIATCGAIVRDRTQAIEIKAIGATFDAMRLLKPGVGLPDGQKFLNGFTTTLGQAIYADPKMDDTPLVAAPTWTHECQHVHQWHEAATPEIRRDHLIWPSELAFPILYVKEDQALAQWEADAYAAGESVRWRIAGFTRSPEEVVENLRSSYRVTAKGLDLCLGMMRSHELTIRSTGQTNVWAAVQAHKIMDSLGVPVTYTP